MKELLYNKAGSNSVVKHYKQMLFYNINGTFSIKISSCSKDRCH